MSTQTVIILGGGFGGIKCARMLKKLFGSAPSRLVLFNRQNHMVFHPLLAEVASATVQPKDVAAPIRQLVDGPECRTEEVRNIDIDEQFIEYEAYNGERKKMHYDQLVIACGSDSNLAIVPGMDEHAFGLKTIGDALALQAHIMEQLDKAEVCDDTACQRRFLSFVVVGGGFSGVEVAGEINELVRRSVKFYKNIKRDDVTVTIVHSRERLLPEVNASLSEFARRKMAQAGVKILLNMQVVKAGTQGVVLADGTHIAAGTIVCTIGTKPSSLVQRLTVEKMNGRLLTKPDMSLPSHPNVWAIGDCAAIVNALDGSFCPPVAQFAERQGTQVAHNIIASINNGETHPFKYKMMGQLCSIGGRNAVAEVMGLHVSGFAAWFLWRGIYLMKLPSLPQKIKVGIEWACDCVFPRTLAYLKPDRSKRVTRAYFGAGEFVFREGDPANEFYMIQQGEVEVVREKEQEPGEIIAILGPGDYFGEGALLDRHTRTAAVRARSAVELVVMGKNVFSEISNALSPLKESLAKAITRRKNVWTNLEDVREIVDAIPLESLIDPLPGASLLPEHTTLEAIERINKHRLDFCCVINKQGELIGIITRSDLLRALEVTASLPKDQRLTVCVKDIMVPDPVVVSIGDGTLLAVATMRERGMKRIPVIEANGKRIVMGYIRIENVMDHVIQKLHGVTREKVTSRAAPTREINQP